EHSRASWKVFICSCEISFSGVGIQQKGVYRTRHSTRVDLRENQPRAIRLKSLERLFFRLAKNDHARQDKRLAEKIGQSSGRHNLEIAVGMQQSEHRTTIGGKEVLDMVVATR